MEMTYTGTVRIPEKPDEEPAKAPVPEPAQPNGDSPSKRS
jgi:hypothetical protein